MSDDLVTRAKAQAKAALNGSGRDSRTLGAVMGLLIARIESDAATIARLTAERDSASGLALTLQAECERLHGDVDALVEAAQGMSSPIKNVDFETRLEQHGRLFAAVTAAKGAK